MMTVKVDSKIIIQQPTKGVEQWCRQWLVIDNPEYYKKERMGKWTGNTPREIYLYERNGDELWVPFGCMMHLWKLCVRNVPWHMNIAPIRQVSYESSINLYPYQEKAVKEALRIKNGVLVMPCGSGKTQCGLEIISRIGGRALWLTHTQDLLNQSKKRAEAVLTMPAGAIGTITAGKVNIGTYITFATVQTLSKIDLAEHRDTWDVIVVDECQHCAGSPTKVTQFYKVVSQLAARYKFGLTATPRRADSLERSMFALLGPKIHEVTREEVADTTCPICVRQVNTGWFPDCDCVLMGDGTIDYHKVVENMTQDECRFEVIMDTLMKLPYGDSVIVLANRVEYLNRLCDAYKERQVGKAICLSGMGNSKKAKEERKVALMALNTGELDCVFCTYQLAAEGLDVPNLRYVVFATPEKDETTVVQSVGRVGRKAEGKDHGTVIDFVDSFGMYRGWANKRAGYYKKIGAEVVE